MEETLRHGQGKERPVDSETGRLRQIDLETSGPIGAQSDPEMVRHRGADPSKAEPSAMQDHGALARGPRWGLDCRTR